MLLGTAKFIDPGTLIMQFAEQVAISGDLKDLDGATLHR